MLKYFEVTNYRGFKDTISIDFSKHREYSFHKDFIKNGLVNKGLIYGKNGSGKSNFGFALFDITYHLTDKFKPEHSYSYQNGDNIKKPVNFKYIFNFDSEEIVYEYSKANPYNILTEKLTINKRVMIDYSFSNKDRTTLMCKDAEHLRDKIVNLRSDQSIVRYIYNNSAIEESSHLTLLINFVDNMLWFRSVINNQFGGFKENSEKLEELLEQGDALTQFQKFLIDVDKNLKYDLSIEKDAFGQKILIANFENGTRLPFKAIASTGTLSLWLFFCWSLSFDKISFLFVDEFDAFYHYETSELILKMINSNSNFQSFVTTHNTALMDNTIIRPDCCYIISDNRELKSLDKCTMKELREAHSLERMYKNNGFTI